MEIPNILREIRDDLNGAKATMLDAARMTRRGLMRLAQWGGQPIRDQRKTGTRASSPGPRADSSTTRSRASRRSA